MSTRRTWTVASRVALQLLQDRRTLVYIFVLPALVTLLLGYVLRQSHGSATLAVTGIPAETMPGLAAISGVTLVTLEEAEAARQLAAGEVDGIVAVRGEETGTREVEATLHAATYHVAATGRAAALRLASLLALETAPGTAPPLPVSITYTAGGAGFEALDYNAPGIVAFFPFFFVFILTTVSFLHERTLGTLERLLVTPLRRLELSAGYMIGFGGFALLQSAVIVGVALLALDLHHHGQVWALFLVAILAALGAVNLGILLSTYASTELQAVQFTPAVIVPQGLLGGLIFPLSTLPGVLQAFAHLMPLTYATDALQRIMVLGEGADNARLWLDLGMLAGFAGLFLALASLTIRHEGA